MNEFEELLCECRGAIERFVNLKLPSEFDADDVLQEVYMAANAKFETLKNQSTFRAWIIGIARHKCTLYRNVAKVMEIPLEEISETALFTVEVGYYRNVWSKKRLGFCRPE